MWKSSSQSIWVPWLPFPSLGVENLLTIVYMLTTPHWLSVAGYLFLLPITAALLQVVYQTWMFCLGTFLRSKKHPLLTFNFSLVPSGKPLKKGDFPRPSFFLPRPPNPLASAPSMPCHRTISGSRSTRSTRSTWSAGPTLGSWGGCWYLSCYVDAYICMLNARDSFSCLGYTNFDPSHLGVGWKNGLDRVKSIDKIVDDSSFSLNTSLARYGLTSFSYLDLASKQEALSRIWQAIFNTVIAPSFLRANARDPWMTPIPHWNLNIPPKDSRSSSHNVSYPLVM